MKIMNSARPRNTSMRGSRRGRAFAAKLAAVAVGDDGMDQVHPVALFEKCQRGTLVPHRNFGSAPKRGRYCRKSDRACLSCRALIRLAVSKRGKVTVCELALFGCERGCPRVCRLRKQDVALLEALRIVLL